MAGVVDLPVELLETVNAIIALEAGHESVEGLSARAKTSYLNKERVDMGDNQKHAPFNASSAERRYLCPGSWSQERKMPNTSSSYAEEGTRAHEVLEDCLRKRERKVVALDVPDDMGKAVQTALDYIYAILDEFPDAILYIEQRVKFPSEAAKGDAWGTLDVGIYIPSLLLLYVIDYKHGAGVSVYIVENRQLLQYATSFIHTTGLVVAEAVLAIVQPRIIGQEPIQEWGIDQFELYNWRLRLEDEIVACLAPGAPLNPGKKQCQFCSATSVCPELERRNVEALHHAFRNIKDVSVETMKSQELDVVRLSEILRAKTGIEDWLASVEEFAIEQAKAGVEIPGFKLVSGKARRVLNVDSGVLIASLSSLSEMSAEDLTERLMPRSEPTLGRIEDVLKESYKRMDPELKAKAIKVMVDGLTIKKSSMTVQLVPESDKRPEVSKPSDVFASVVHVPVSSEG